MNRRGARQVLAVVDDQQQMLGARGSVRPPARPTRPRAATIASELDDRRGHILRSFNGRERHELRAVGEVGLDGRATSSASRVLPTPPGPVSVSSRTEPARSRSATASSSSPATDRPIRRRRQRAASTGCGPRRSHRAALEAGSWASIACCRSCELGAPGSIPSCLDEHVAGVAGRPPAPRPGGRCDTARASAARAAARATGARLAQLLELARPARVCAPAARSASTRSSTAASRCSSSRAISAGANGAHANSASGGPRHSASASRSTTAARSGVARRQRRRPAATPARRSAPASSSPRRTRSR